MVPLLSYVPLLPITGTVESVPVMGSHGKTFIYPTFSVHTAPS